MLLAREAAAAAAFFGVVGCGRVRLLAVDLLDLMEERSGEEREEAEKEVVVVAAVAESDDEATLSAVLDFFTGGCDETLVVEACAV